MERSEKATLTASGFAAGLSVKDDKFDQGVVRNLATIRFRDPEGGRVLLFQTVRTDTKKKDENGKEVALRPETSFKFDGRAGRWWRVKQTTETINPNASHPEDYSVKSRYAEDDAN